ncbi:poly-beta-hydroxybutyrate-responsive repressor [Rubrobacter marinus]|uniref:Poly-beta-hydroxybutyrate-responsive repressor n=1 Tax=Rubrobacter marinus TaxID=2653852 RepID=A0A6G8Q185_9ACTN|nr:helix-turn-helix transcriptional regulator [Rubrobacter marinus]QIN80236.1 poly-beta-hydroxybutyrate-responsive repressor [Rubrobacter marinus]
MPPKVEARPKNWLEAVVLASLREQESYGYELMRRLTRFGAEATNPGTLYRTLRRMEREGWCTSEWETSKGGPARRRYSLTAAGEAYLDLWIAALEDYQRHVDALFNLYAGERS